jgi:hypothetical protein
MVVAITLAVADENALGARIKFGCRAIVNPIKINVFTVFRFSHKAISFSAHSAQVKAIANRSPTDMIVFSQFSQKLAHSYHM